jgi:hypothetical protein
MNCQGFNELPRRNWFGNRRNARATGLILAVVAIAGACHRAGSDALVGGPGAAKATTAKETSVASSEIRDTSRSEMTKPDPFSDFRSAVSKYFAPVAADFGLGTGVGKTIYPEMYVDFHGSGRGLGIGYELESGAWAYVVVTTARVAMNDSSDYTRLWSIKRGRAVPLMAWRS